LSWLQEEGPKETEPETWKLGDRRNVSCNFDSCEEKHEKTSRLSPYVPKTFLIDAFVFPGNSGGPVVSAVDITAITGTKAQNTAYLIGMVKGYVPYDDVAVSQQTGRPRMVSEENSGLAEVIPVDFINETIEFDRRSHAQSLSPH
jgi:hypothetical protein